MANNEKNYAVLEDTKRLGFFAKLKQWWLRLIREEYHLTVYFVVAAVSNPETGEKTVTRTKKTFKLKSVNKRKQNHFTGTDINGNWIEIKTVEPFDYYLEKVY